VIYLFDIDGTLISAHGAGRRAFERALAQEFGIAEGLRGIQLDGKTDPMILDEAFAAAGRGAATVEDRARIFAAYLSHLPNELAQATYRVLPGVERALDYLESQGAVIGLATGNVEGGARHKLERGGLWHRFAFGGYGSDAHGRAELVRIAVERGRQRATRSVAAEEVWVLGDTPRDIAAAHAAGVRAVGVATGSYDVAALRDAGADVVVTTLEEWAARVSV
jgi:phosphoglycolate phosphatase-like HAD superfamily hydrolase